MMLEEVDPARDIRHQRHPRNLHYGHNHFAQRHYVLSGRWALSNVLFHWLVHHQHNFSPRQYSYSFGRWTGQRTHHLWLYLVQCEEPLCSWDVFCQLLRLGCHPSDLWRLHAISKGLQKWRVSENVQVATKVTQNSNQFNNANAIAAFVQSIIELLVNRRPK